MCEIEKSGYPHYMLKEIYEQPEVIKRTLKERLIPGSEGIVLDGIGLTQRELDGVHRMVIVACGTSYHAGLAGKYLIESLAGIPVEVEIASEFRYRSPAVDKNSLVIVISQSGETADTLDALRTAKGKGARVLAITNVVGSTIPREADYSIYTCAGPEVSVASTKAYTSQLIVIYLIALQLAYIKGGIGREVYRQMLEAVNRLPEQAQKMLDCSQSMKELAGKHKDIEKIVYLGRGLDYALALEGSLKFKETCYIHSAAYPGGEFRHGPIALVEEGLLVVLLATQDALIDKTLANLKEVKDRGAYVVALAKEGDGEVGKLADRVVYIPDIFDEFTSALAVIPLQLFAYYSAVARGRNVDRPRSLVKSVTD
ncbi:MAG: glutamine--fructose-6-phosphate transaminase (isomerizing) [Clostridia bacterium]|nr:glutamine--fructose-6-phosphate transaminase (isomerizing) [Clostridiales bacterium]